MFMEDIINSLVNDATYGAYAVKVNDMLPEISGIKYSEMLYNPKKENPWAIVKQGEPIMLWIIPK